MLEVELIAETGGPYRARLRPGTPTDRRALVLTWQPVLDAGPARWLDREWSWATIGKSELHVEASPELLVIADEVETGASGDVLGVLVTTGPTTVEHAGIAELLELDGGLLWVEQIATAPSLRKDCPPAHRRKPRLKLVGSHLMRAAIARSRSFGLGGRIGLHAEGEIACATYDGWLMRSLGDGVHRAGGMYPVYFGDGAWADRFCSAPDAPGRR
jgi:hypothetical protein